MTLMIVIIRIINISLTNTVKHKHTGRKQYFQNLHVNIVFGYCSQQPIVKNTNNK